MAHSSGGSILFNAKKCATVKLYLLLIYGSWCHSFKGIIIP